jgi:hypothetical protein
MGAYNVTLYMSNESIEIRMFDERSYLVFLLLFTRSGMSLHTSHATSRSAHSPFAALLVISTSRERFSTFYPPREMILRG